MYTYVITDQYVQITLKTKGGSTVMTIPAGNFGFWDMVLTIRGAEHSPVALKNTLRAIMNNGGES